MAFAQQQGASGELERESTNDLSLENDEAETSEERSKVDGCNGGEGYVRPGDPRVHLSGNDVKQNRRRSDAGNSESTCRVAPKCDPQIMCVRGLNPPDDKMLKIVFHVLVHQPVWEWDAESQMHIRFGHSALGSWECDCGPFKVGRKLDNELYEMIGEVIINSDLSTDTLTYKYTVFSPKTETDEDCYEYLYDYGGSGNVNRCLQISDKQYSPRQGTIHHYDTIAYPQNMIKTLYQRTVGRALQYLWRGGQQSEEDEEKTFRPLKLSQICDICFKFYLEDHHKALSECSVECDIPTVVHEISSVYYSLQSPLLLATQDEVIEYNRQSQLSQHMKEWLESIIESLKGVSDESRKLLSAVTIACCFFKFSRHCSKVDRFAVSVLEMLQLKPIVEARRCPDYELLCDALPKPHELEKAAICIHHLITCLVKSKEFKSPEWLAAIPLFHFLKGYSRPFERPGMNLEKIFWGVREKELELDKLTTRSRPGFIDAHYNRLKPLFMADPLFLQMFIYLTPQKDFPVLFKKIPTYLSATWLSQKANTMDSLNKVKACEWIDWLCVLKEVVLKSVEDGFVELSSMVEASLLLCNNLAVKLTSPERHYVEVLGASISLFFFAIHRLTIYNAEQVIKVSFDKLKPILRKWITHNKVIGGSFFGFNTELLRAEEETQLWQILLVLQCPSPQSTELWHKIAKPLILGRMQAVVQNVPEKSRIDLVVSLLETCENVHPILTDAVIEAGMIALERPKCEGYSCKEFETLVSTECARIGILLGAMMKKQYPHLNPGLRNISVSLNELLQWNLWPNFITLYEMDTKLNEYLPQECGGTCVYAISKMRQVCSRIRNREITMGELQKITENPKQMRRLCIAATSQRKHNEKEAVITALHQRLEEFEVFEGERKLFERRRECLHHLCSQLHIGVQGLHELKQELESNFNTDKICKLCTREQGGNIRIHYFQSTGPLNTFAKNFYIMTHTYSSDIFLNVWKSTMVAWVRRNPSPTITDLFHNVWQPAFSQCQKLLDQLHEQSMELADVDRHFKQYQGPHLESQLMKTFQGVDACLDQRHNEAWIKNIARRMNDYWNLCKYQDAANTFLLLRSALCLTGDFRNVESLSTVASSMKNQTLQSVNESLIETSQFLKDTALNPGKLQCLHTFARCHEVIQWMQEVTKSMSDLQTFVNVALSTAAGGEDDLARDRLSNLGTVGSGFGSLIYNLPQHAGYHELVQQCTLLWDAIQNNPSLPQILEGCNDALEWYKSVKETQGSVEDTSFGKLKHMLTYGHFHIGSQSKKAVQSIHEIIHLKLLKTGKQLPQMSYSLDDLRDLESKLVLITGSKAKNREEVNKFLNTLHSVCRIADVLIALQQAGNVKYIGWVLSFSCVTDSCERLRAVARDMEDELQKWKNEVEEARGRLYELNYYTILQLLFLRSELGKMKGPTVCANVIKPATLSLLHSISPGITASDVVEKVSAVFLQQTRAKRTVGADLAFPTSQSLMSQDVVASDVYAIADCRKKGKKNSARLATGCTLASIPPPADVPRAKPAQAKLTNRQMEIFANLVDYCEFPSQLALKAIEQFGEDEYEMKNWCMQNNELQEEDPEQEGSSCDTESVFEEPESDEDIAKHLLATVSDGIKSSPQLSITIRQPIDEYHPDVRSLVEAGFTAEQSMEAIEQYDSVSAAMDYLMSGGNEEIFQPTLLSEVDQTHGPKTEQKALQCSEEKGFIVYSNENAEVEYLSIHVLGIVLHEFSSFPAVILSKRTFQTVLKAGQPNLLVTFPENVLKTTLSLYMENKCLPLPTYEEVLVCYPNTTAEEVILLCRRAFGDPGFKRIFCVAHAEKLSYQVCDRVLRIFTKLSHGKTDYRLVIICSNKDEQKSIISKLQLFRRQYSAFADTPKLQSYLKFHFTREIQNSHQQCGAGAAAYVDCEHSCVRVVASHRSGMGKSLYIRRMTSRLDSAARVIVPIHGPVVSPDTVLEFLSQHTANSQCTIFHFDIAPGILWKVDCILFCLLVLRGLSDSKGRIWHCHPSQLYAIEVTLTDFQGSSQVFPESQTLAFLDLLPTVECVSPRRALELMVAKKKDPGIVLMDEGEFKSVTFQRVYQYLNRHNQHINLDRFSYANTEEGNKADCLKIILHYCGIHDPSWSEVLHFVHFLDVQLRSCEGSIYCDQKAVGDVLKGLKSFVVKFMIRMSRDFATSSLQGVVSRENKGQRLKVGGGLQHYEIVKRRCWENSSHPYVFFNQDTTITFVGFRVTQNGDLIDPVHKNVLESAIMSKNLYAGLIQNKVHFDEDYRMWQKSVLIQKIGTVIGLEPTHIKDPDPSYVLTVDNLIKILAIQMRFRCGIPVVIMGETGCGKTRLIRYMCDLAKQGKRIQKNMFIMKVHGGITEMDVVNFIQQAEEQAVKNHKSNLDTVVFFDEANTTEAIGLIKEVVCDRRLHGKPLSPDLKFIAACNPYRKHTDEMIEKLESAGLGFHVRNTQQKIGQIPLRHLVYRVLDLPPSMRPLVYDFGQLNTDTERDYIGQMVSDHVKGHCGLPHHFVAPIASALLWSHQYMRKRQDECSFVSLRDIKRAMIVMEFFLNKLRQMNFFGKAVDRKAAEATCTSVAGVMKPKAHKFVRIPPTSDNVTRSLVLALSVCYHARLQDRGEYEQGVVQKFTSPLKLEGAEQFRNEIKWCQEVLLDNMTLGPNIARNTALRENIFMMVVCIELRIPLFLVGKPGSSKSLAKAIVSNSLQGQTSSNDLLKGFKQVHMFSYQCSQLSTPESVIEVFNIAKKFQQDQDTTKYVSVVVLDEVGLAEDSPNLPLKALHPLLEDGTEGAEDSEAVIDREKRVAFIGISNWALDPAKMNRGVMVTRQDPDIQELELSARGICSYKDNDLVKERLEGYFQPLAEAYKAICEKQKREFFGLRDFYSLIKMLYWLCEKSDRYPTWPQLEHVIRRNFGGLEDEDFDPLEEFQKRIPNKEIPDMTLVPPELHSIVKPDSSPLGLIKTSLSTKEISWHGENRYLLFLTENYSALEILRHYLHDVVGSASHTDPALDGEGRPERMDPFILFGSSFPKDREYTQVCRNIYQIKICMETGRTAILLNLENLYESLYDLLNQYYIYNGGSKYVDLGLQTHRVKCRVHDNFKLILIAEKTTVYNKYPTPLINRLEKHFVLTSSVLTKWQLEVMEQLQEWAHLFSCVSGFKARNVFIGYQKDTPATVVFQATNQLQNLKKMRESPGDSRKWEGLEQASVLGTLQLDELMKEIEGSELWKRAVFQLSQCLLLQTASPDAFARLKYTSLADQQESLWRLYDEVQHHTSLEDFLLYHLVQRSSEDGLLLQVTTHSHLLSGQELERLGNVLGYREHMSWFLLQEFDTELDFSSKVSPTFQRDRGDTDDFLLILQCDSGHLDVDLIACARYRIYDERAKSMMQGGGFKLGGSTHVLFVIYMPQQAVSSTFVGFQGDPWISTHIDDIRHRYDAITLCEAMKMPISHLFIGLDDEHKVSHESKEMPTEELLTMGAAIADPTERSMLEHRIDSQPKSKLPQKSGYFLHLHSCIQAAASRLQDSAKNKERTTDRVKLLVDLIPRPPTVIIDDSTFHGILILHIYELLKERERVLEDESSWVVNEALSSKQLQSGGTFRNVITRKLDRVIVPIFAEIIALIDHNYNLDLADPRVPVFQFWLAMFRNHKVMQFIYTEMVVREQVPGAGSRMAEEEFQCQLPFSWLVWEAFKAQWEAAKSTAGSNWAQLYTQLCVLVSETPIGEVLASVDKTSSELFYQHYLHDFVRSVHKCNHRKPEYAEMEYRLIAKALSGVVHSTEVFSSISGHEYLTCRIAALHVIHQNHQSHILWFGLLASYLPGVLVTLEQRLPTDSEEMLLHLCAVERALEILEPKAALNKDDSAVHDWLNLLRLTQNAIAPILNLPSQHEIARKARLQWQLICVVQMFIKHIVSKYDGMIAYAKRLEMYLKTDPAPDFLKCSTIEKIKKHLNAMDAELQKKFKDNPKKLASIRRSCRAFFMEMVSTLCFGATNPPEEELIQMLINTVFEERHEVEPEKLWTRDFNYREIDTDQIPTIRSFLLQLLLEHNTELVKACLGNYFRMSRQALATVNMADRDLYLLYTQCFEDSLYKRFIAKPFHVRLTSATSMLKEARIALKMTSRDQRHALLNILEGVAKARYGLSVVAILLNKQICGGGTDCGCNLEIIQKLLQETKTLCTDEDINHIDVTGDSDTTGPVVYLLKLLVRQYGTHCLQCVRETHQWVLPHELVQVDTGDPFVLYGQSYSGLRQSVTKAIIEKHYKQIFETLKALSSQEKPLLLLAFYSLSRTNATYSRQIRPDELNEVGKTIAESKVLSKELQWMCRALLANEQGGPLTQLTVTSGQTHLQQTLGNVVVHTAAVLLCRERVGLLQPFVDMLHNTADLVNTYLPTMPEDLLPEAKKAVGGTFYECPRGHPYLITECGRPVQQYQCPVCGSQIGGTHYQLKHDNRIARRNDYTQTGYCLGQADSRSSVPAPERSLSPVTCCILRVLMHSALLWASCNYQSEMKGLLHLVKPRLNSAELPQFFWLHLEKDLELLEQATGKSVDEVAIVVHLVLKGILTRGDAVRVASILATRDARAEWEKEFKRVFIEPVLEKMEENVITALDLIIDDNKEDYLLYLVYEKIPLVKVSLNPHLWTYRSRITVEYLNQTLQQQRLRKQYPILYHFLKEEHTLRATQYLPDIVRMQRLLFDTFHHRLDHKDAKHITIGQFLRERRSGNIHSEYQRMVESLQRAWLMVGDQLRDHARLRIDTNHLLPAITDDTPLEYLIPTTTGAGAVTTALVDFLVLTHNNFIEKCRGIVADQEERLSKSPLARQNHPVLLPHVHRCHLLDYENQLHSIILSHCQYSLVVGSGQKICYDWPALEQHILGRFIHGKPLIQCDIPQVEYKKDIYTVATFDAIRKKVNPQVQLDSQIKHEIIQELHSVNRVREALDVVDIVMGFLSSGGGKADRQLGEYITRTLRISKKKQFSEKARKHCTLGHILSLWETLSVELARQIVLSGQDPFDSVKENFSKDLSTKGQQRQTRALDRCLRSFNLDQLLEALYALIETHIKYCPDNEKDWLLVDVLDPFLQNNHLAPIPHFCTEFPNSITLAQTVAVWKHIVLYTSR